MKTMIFLVSDRNALRFILISKAGNRCGVRGPRVYAGAENISRYRARHRLQRVVELQNMVANSGAKKLARLPS
ncbi:MAG: hypothetical protein ACU83P_11710 [Gammaproteobacteria bacterium]